MQKENSFTPLSEANLKETLDFNPVESLGQSFLVDPARVSRFVSLTIADADVVEIGSGPGNLTFGIAKVARHVIGLEIYRGYADAQAKILSGLDNVEIVNTDALRFNFRQWINKDPEAQHQVIGNIPFHISEPLLAKLAQVSDGLDDITLMVGDNLAKTMTTTNPASEWYTHLSFIAGIFDVLKVDNVPRTCCWPVPRTDSAIMSLTPKGYPEGGIAQQLQRRIVLSQPENLTLMKVINSFSVSTTEGKVLGKDTSHRYDRRQTQYELKQIAGDYNQMPANRSGIVSRDSERTRRLSERMNLPAEILSKPFSRIDNQEVRKLAMAITNL